MQPRVQLVAGRTFGKAAASHISQRTEFLGRAKASERKRKKFVLFLALCYSDFLGGQLNPLFAPGLKKRTRNYGASLWVGKDLQIT